jgi:hypothetical protein
LSRCLSWVREYLAAEQTRIEDALHKFRDSEVATLAPDTSSRELIVRPHSPPPPSPALPLPRCD